MGVWFNAGAYSILNDLNCLNVLNDLNCNNKLYARQPDHR
jgi:hypothetical protein